MQDLCQYSDNELSLTVYNDEFLYKRRHRSDFKALLNELYIFTDDQWETFVNDLEDENI